MGYHPAYDLSSLYEKPKAPSEPFDLASLDRPPATVPSASAAPSPDKTRVAEEPEPFEATVARERIGREQRDMDAPPPDPYGGVRARAATRPELRAPAAPPDATRAPPDAHQRYRPGVVERTGEQLGEFAHQAVTQPIRTASSIPEAIGTSAVHAVLSPGVGEARPDPRLSKGGAPGLTDEQLERDQRQPYDPEHGAVTSRERTEAGLQTLANVGAGGIASLTERGLVRAGVEKAGANIAGHAAAGGAAMATYSPNDPAAGFLAGATLGVAADRVAKAGGSAVDRLRDRARGSVTPAAATSAPIDLAEVLPTEQPRPNAPAPAPEQPSAQPPSGAQATEASKSTLPVAEARPATSGAALGRDTRVLLRDGQALPAQYAVISADQLRSSHDPFSFQPTEGYPEGVQGRDYQRNKASQTAVAQRSMDFNADLALNPSELASEGTPTVLPDGTVIAGNERSMHPRRALVQAPEKYARYTDQLKARAAEFGLNPDELAAVKNPVLVRRLTSEGDIAGGPPRWSEINRLSDEVATKAKSATEEGTARAAKLSQARESMEHFASTIAPDQTVMEYLGTSHGRDFVRKLQSDGVITPEEFGRFSDGSGTLTEDGRTAVRRMLLSTAVTDPAAVLDAPAAAVTKIEHAVPAIVSTKGTTFDASRVTTAALKMLAEARDNGVTIKDLASLLGDVQRSPVVSALAEFLSSEKPTAVKSAFRRYAALAREALGNAESTDMFGGTGFDTPLKAFREAFGIGDESLDVAASGPLATPARRGGLARTMDDAAAEMRRRYEESIKPGEMAQRARQGETREAVTSLTGQTPERLSLDRRQAELFGAEETHGPREDEPHFGDDEHGPDQLALFSPAGEATPFGKRARAAMGMTSQQSAAAAQRVETLASISRNLAEAVGVPLRQGRFLAKQMQALGAFFPQSEVARLRRFDRIGTAAHEVGHYISKHHLRNPTMMGAAARGAEKLSTAAKRELVQMGRDLYGNRKANGGYGEEGIAQWARFYVTDPARLAKDAPTFAEWIEKNVFPKEPALKAALDQAQRDYADHVRVPASARFDAMISVRPEHRLIPEARTLVTTMLDDLHEFRQAVAELGGAKSPEKDAYVLARLTRGAAGAAEEMIERGIVDPRTGDRVAPAYAEVLGRLKPEEVQPFRRFVAAERTLEVAQRGVDTGFTVPDSHEIIRTSPAHFRAIAEDLWKISNALIDYREAKGLITRDEARVIKEKNQRRVGFYRVFEDDETARPQRGSGRGFGRNSSGLQAIKGSSRQILDPLESMITDHYRAVQQANTADVMRTLYRHAMETEGGGRVIERLIEAPKRPITIPWERIKGQIAEKMAELGVDVPDSMMIDEIPGVLTAFEELSQAGTAENKDLVMPIVDKGERVWLQIKDRQLYEAVKGLNAETMPLWLRLVSIPTRTLRAGATLTGEFIARNPVKDAFSAAVFTRGDVPIPGVDLARGLFHVLKHDELYQRWRLAGGDNAAMLGIDRPSVQRSIGAILRAGHGVGASVIDRLEYRRALEEARAEGLPAAKARALAVDAARGWVLRPLDTLRMMSSLMENATRVGEYAAVEGKALKRGASSRAAATEGAIAARDVTIDFAQAGTVVRNVNQIMSFLNANIRGLAKLGRELRERPQVVVPRIAAWITLPSVALYWKQKDDPAYQEVPAWQKMIAWVIVQRGGDGQVKHIWRIPKPPELGILFGSMPEQLLEWTRRHDPHALEALAQGFGNLNPIHWPDALSPLIAAWANKDTFTDRPIVPEGVKDLPPAAQSSRYTGESARAVGELTNQSPAKIESLVRGYFGGLGQYGMDVSDAAVRKVRAARGLPPLAPAEAHSGDPLTRIPVVRGFTVREPQLNSESVTRTLADFHQADGYRREWRRMLDAGERVSAGTYLANHRKEIMSVATAEEAGDAGPLRVLYQQIIGAQQLTSRAGRAPISEPRARRVQADAAAVAVRAGRRAQNLPTRTP